MDDVYHSIAAYAQAEIKVKGSRFIAEAFPVANADGAEAKIAEIRKREYNATHHCTAYRVGADGAVFRFNDDGEPSGTAGAPMLRQIDGRGLTNTLVVVTRYYGGTKLGTGGLIRAYGDAASEVLDHCTITQHILRTAVRVRFAYDDTSPALHTIQQFDTVVQETHYSEDTEMRLGVRRSVVDQFVAAFVNALAGRGTAEVVDEESA